MTEDRRQRAKQRLIRNITFGAVVMVALLMTALSLIAFDREQQAQTARTSAEREAAVSRSLVLANNAREAQAAGNTDAAIALALQAVRMDDPPLESQRALRALAVDYGTRAILVGHSEAVRTVAFSPDSKLGLSGSCAELSAEGDCSRGEIILWDLQTYAEVRRFEGHTGWVNAIVFSPDGVTALSASGDHSLILWDVASGTVIRRFEGHSDSVTDVVFSPDGQTAISSSSDKTLILWDVGTGSIVRRFEGHNDAVNCLALAPDGKTVVSGSEDATIAAWDVATGQLIRLFEGHTNGIVHLSFFPDGQSFMSAGKDMVFRRWYFAPDQPPRVQPYTSINYGLTVAPDGNTILFGEFGALVPYSMAQNNYIIPSLTNHDDTVLAIAVSADGHQALSGSVDKTIHLSNLAKRDDFRRFEALGQTIGSIAALSPDKRYLATGTLGEVVVWDVATGVIVKHLAGDEGFVLTVEFSPDGKTILAGSVAYGSVSGKGSLILWDFESGEIVRRFEGAYGGEATFSPDGKTILIGVQQGFGSLEGGLALWDTTSGNMIRRFETTVGTRYPQFSPDGQLAIAESSVPNVNTSPGLSILWDVTTGREVRRFAGAWGQMTPLQDTVLTTNNGAYVLWDVRSGAMLRRFSGHYFVGLFDVDYSPDQRYMISGDGQGVAILWDFNTGAELQRFDSRKILPDLISTYIWGSVFAPDGKSVYLMVSDSVLNKVVPIQWFINVQSLDEVIQWIDANRYVRDLTCDERERFRAEPLCDTTVLSG